MSKNIFLITGGSGFIGSYLSNYIHLLQLGEIYIVDKEKPPKYINKNIFYKKIDILNLESLEKFICSVKPNYIFHLAARTDLRGNSLESYKNNIVGTENIIKCTKKVKSIKRIIFASSMLVCKVGYKPKNEFDYCPSNFYGMSKVIMEKLIRKESLKYSWCIVRPTSIWGPGFKEPYKNFFNLILQKKYFHIGNKKTLKTYGYIGNIAHQLIELITKEGKLINRKTFYLGDNSKYNIREWADEISKLSISGEIKTLPPKLVFILSLIGTLLNKFKIKIPLTLFRFKNMTTDNILDLEPIKKVSQKLPFNREDAIKLTLKWILNEMKYDSYNEFKKLMRTNSKIIFRKSP